MLPSVLFSTHTSIYFHFDGNNNNNNIKSCCNSLLHFTHHRDLVFSANTHVVLSSYISHGSFKPDVEQHIEKLNE